MNNKHVCFLRLTLSYLQHDCSYNLTYKSERLHYIYIAPSIKDDFKMHINIYNISETFLSYSTLSLYTESTSGRVFLAQWRVRYT